MTAEDAAEALANADRVTSYETGMCLKYVRGPCWELGSLYGSAIEAWNGAKFKHPGDRHPPAGAPCFYSGGTYGHIVIARGGPEMRSTDCTTTGRVSDAALGWIEDNWAGRVYLGWSEDLNGTRLPLASDTNPPGDDMPQYDRATTRITLKLAAEKWYSIEWDKMAAGDAVTIPGRQFKLSGRTYSADLHATVEAPQGSIIRLRTVELEDSTVVEENPQVEVIATGGSTFAAYSGAGGVQAGRALAFRVWCSEPATLTDADAAVLSWE